MDYNSVSQTINRIAFIGNYLPRQCGIATFTTDLCEAVAAEYAGTAWHRPGQGQRPRRVGLAGQARMSRMPRRI